MIGHSKQFKCVAMHSLPNDKDPIKVNLPHRVYVLESASEQVLVGSARFRVNGRFPVLTYFNKAKNIAIWRSS